MPPARCKYSSLNLYRYFSSHSPRAAVAHQTKPTGDISSVFPSLSGLEQSPLPPRFADLKKHLVQGHEAEIEKSWRRLLRSLQEDTAQIRAAGSSIIPEISFDDVRWKNVHKMTTFRDQLREHGVAIVRGVVTEGEALGWKTLVQRYIQNNSFTKGFPPDKPAVYELYWSPSQLLARAHPNLLLAQKFLMSHWRSSSSALVSTSYPCAYADRLRIRQPDDAGFSLGPHVDGGSCERWEEDGYGRGSVYEKIFEGQWEQYDPWESSCRLPVRSDLYNGAGACSMFRMFQGWLSLSHTSPGEGTLKVMPLLAKATAYFLLRPFFHARNSDPAASSFLDPDNWFFEPSPSSILQGAVPAACQELTNSLHPHLDLANTMTSIPTVRPGDYVAWHCDTIHAVDRLHKGTSDSSVLYIPACPLTEANAEYLVRQREAWWEGLPGPDFPGGGAQTAKGMGMSMAPNESETEGSENTAPKGEADFLGGLSVDAAMEAIRGDGARAMGLQKWEEGLEKDEGVRGVLRRANTILGFS